MTFMLEPPRARRHPVAILVYYGFQLVAALSLVAPLAQALGQGVSRFPKGDQLLFEPGAQMLVETLRVEGSALRTALQAMLWQLPVWWVLGVFAAACLTVALATPTARSAEKAFEPLWVRAAGITPAFLLLAGTSLILRGLVWLGCIGLGSALKGSLTTRWGDPVGWGALLGTLTLAVLISALVSALDDLARALVVQRRISAWRALSLLPGIPRTQQRRLFLDWLVATTASLLLVVLAAAAERALPGVAAESTVLLVITGVRQTAMLGQVAWRASWLCAALRWADLSNVRASDSDYPGIAPLPEHELAPHGRTVRQ